MTKLTVAFRNFANAPKEGKHREKRKTDEKKNFHTLNTLAGIMRQQMIRAPEQAYARFF
jgi:DNA/RNA-binding domain of Phe-tRNA-synthetase-like protein